jgi:hypothetical protein
VGWKQRAHIQSSGVRFETAGSRSKQWGWVRNGRLVFEAVGLSSKRRVRILGSSGVGLKTAGSHLKHRGGLEMAGSRLKQWGQARNGGLAFKAAGSGLKRRARI